MNTAPGAWVVIHCPATRSFLFGKRSGQVNKPHLWNLFGGHVDESENPEQGALRELKEETGLEPAIEGIIHPGQTRVLDVGYVSALREMHFYLLLTETELEPTLNHEHSSYRWFKPNTLPHDVNRPTAIALNIGVIEKSLLIAEELADQSPT